MIDSEIANRSKYDSKPAFKGLVWIAVVVVSTGLAGFTAENPGVVKIKACLKDLDLWIHNGWRANTAYGLFFEEKNAALRRVKFSSGNPEADKISKSEVQRDYSETYIEKPNDWLEKPRLPEYIETGFTIPASKIDYKKLKLIAKKVIPSKEDRMADWPYPLAPVVKAEIYSIGKKPDFSITKMYRSASGFYDSLVVQKVNKVDYYYPLHIRYHREIDGNPDKRYIAEAKQKLTNLFASLEAFTKNKSTDK